MPRTTDLKNVLPLVLAAGKGTRMKSKLPKVLQPVCGRPMLLYLLETVSKLGAGQPWVVVGHGADQVRAILPDNCKIVLQSEQLGTGHAVKVALAEMVPGTRLILVLCGDVPLLGAETLANLIQAHLEGEHHITILTAEFDDPAGYGRIVRGEDGWVFRIVEDKDATSAEKAIREINTGIYVFEEQSLREAIAEIRNDNAQREFYLTDTVESIVRKGKYVGTYLTRDPGETTGLSDKSDLAAASARVRSLILKSLMESGVTIEDPGSTYIDSSVRIEPDVQILPGVYLKGNTIIGEDSIIGPQVLLQDVEVGRGCRVLFTVAAEARIGDKTNVGPFTHIRPGSEIGSAAKIGNFVEVKKSRIGDKTRVAHLTYVGDAEIGNDVNIGAGTIFCNFDGVSKHQSKVGDKSFIGSNATLIAPVEIGNESYVAAGTIVTGDVPSDSLAIAREPMKIKPGWSKKRRIILDKDSK